MRIHNRARAWALQGLYAWEMRGADPDFLVPVLHELYEHLHVSPNNRLFSDVLVRLVAKSLPRVDRVLEEHVQNWRLSRLAVIDRSLLRLGTAELLFLDDVDPRHTVRDLVRLAERYGTPESPRFVHGVLDAVERSVRPRRGAERG